MDMDAVKRRYSETITKEDAFGRAIKVGRLRPAQQLKAAEMSANDSAATTIRLVCMVRGVDDKDLAFPANRAEVDSRLNMLEEEGLAAIVEALKELYGVDDDSEPKELGDAAKNSSAAQVSGKPAG